MSKSLGNSPEPLDLIEKYGADGVRVGMLLCSPAGNDLLYDDNLPEQGRNFANKIWNAFRLVKSWSVDSSIQQPDASKVALEWINEVVNKALSDIDSDFTKFRISEALMTAYKLFWDEFSGWYLEIIKPEYKKPIDIQTYNSTLAVFDKLMHIIHPFMPFITEEIWQLLSERRVGESLMVNQMPKYGKSQMLLIDRFEVVKETVSSIRTIRKDKDLPVREKLGLFIKCSPGDFDNHLLPVLTKMANLSSVSFTGQMQDGVASFHIKTMEFYIPMGGKLNIEAEFNKINEELIYARGFLSSVMKKLDNERFVQNAPPAVIDIEKKKKADAEQKINALEQRILQLKANS
jgi:valyl-tRNA synthetase